MAFLNEFLLKVQAEKESEGDKNMRNFLACKEWFAFSRKKITQPESVIILQFCFYETEGLSELDNSESIIWNDGSRAILSGI